MALFPFSIADIDDPEHIRVVLYASGRMGHAPLNALLKQMHEDMAEIAQRLELLEKQWQKTDLAPITHQQDVKENDQSSKESGEGHKASSESHKTDGAISVLASKPHEEDSEIHLQNSGSLIMEVAPLHVGSDMNLNLSSSVSAPISDVQFIAGSEMKLHNTSENVSSVRPDMSALLRLSRSAGNLMSNTSLKVGGGNFASSFSDITAGIDFNSSDKAVIDNMKSFKVESAKHSISVIGKNEEVGSLGEYGRKNGVFAKKDCEEEKDSQAV
ncbi:hypothetical protein [Bartonella sp. ML70XJBT.G]|uniref:hypothetical protein n=1 Tax=Bartonella sp. ML70XJBT.G TaxID=3019093 RepID=UPI00235E09B3|nr:hypothetical protein [Bartonella sp. ML70XJBT.G]